MSDDLPDRPTNPLIESRLRNSLQPTQLSASQRARHLQRLDERGDEELRYLQQRSLVELGLLAAALVAVLTIAAWLAWPNDATDEPTQLEMAQATLTARANQHAEAAMSPSSNVAAVTTVPDAMSPAAGGTCVVDMPATELPASIPLADPKHKTWYGQQGSDIWLSPLDRVAAGLPQLDYVSGLWFAGGPTYLMWFGTSDPITVSLTQLDGAGNVKAVEPMDINSINYIQHHHIVEIPEPGCWEITGTTPTEEVAFTVDVRPVAERPDLILAHAVYDLRPYPEPVTCQITPWTGPEARFDSYTTPYWLDGDGISLHNPLGWFYAGEEQFEVAFTVEVGVLLDVDDQSVTLNARPLDNPGPAFTEDAIRRQDNRGSLHLTFPTPGCWELETITEGGSETFTVYVYPAECKPDIQAMEIPGACRAPASS